MMYTRAGSALYCLRTYLIICATACVSPPPSCFSDAVVPTSQQLFGWLSGRIRMKPWESAAALAIGMLLSWLLAVFPQEWQEM
jgi:hypothetical protein